MEGARTAGRITRPNLYLPAVVFVALTYFLSSQRFGVLIILIGAVLVSRRSLLSLTSKASLKKLVYIGSIMAVLSTASFIRAERSDVSLSDLSISAGIEATLQDAFYGAYAIDPAKLTGIVLRNQEFLLGQSFVMVFVAPIPRVMWPSKPAVRIGPYVAQEILDYGNNSGAPPSAFGEFYINFGWLGVVIGSFLIGVGAAFVRSFCLAASDPGLGRVRYALLMICLINFLIGDFTYAALFVVKYGLAIVVCEWYWGAKFRHQGQSIPLFSERAIAYADRGFEH